MTPEQVERAQQLARERWNATVRKQEEQKRRDQAQADAQADARRRRMRAV